MQVVEDVEEDVLGLLFAAEELYVINEQHIHHLVEVTEVVDGIIPHRINELVGELFRANVEHGEFGIAFLDLQTNGVCKVRLTKTRRSVDQQWIE